MSSWNEFCSDVERLADKAVKKTNELAHTASLHLKLEGVKTKLSAAFESLGRLTYKQLSSDGSQAEKISEVIATIDSLRKEEKELQKQIDDAKNKNE